MTMHTWKRYVKITYYLDCLTFKTMSMTINRHCLIFIYAVNENTYEIRNVKNFILILFCNFHWLDQDTLLWENLMFERIFCFFWKMEGKIHNRCKCNICNITDTCTCEGYVCTVSSSSVYVVSKSSPSLLCLLQQFF